MQARSRRGGARPRALRALATAALFAVAFALQACCSVKQSVPLECVPKSVTVYIDGDALDEVPPELWLRSDVPHTIFFSGGGYEKRSLILDSRETESGHALEPAEPCRELRFEPIGKSVDFEVEE